MAEKLETNYKPNVIEKQPDQVEKPLNEDLVLQNIQSLLSSVGTLLESISLKNNNEILLMQSKAIKEIEEELSKVIKH